MDRNLFRKQAISSFPKKINKELEKPVGYIYFTSNKCTQRVLFNTILLN